MFMRFHSLMLLTVFSTCFQEIQQRLGKLLRLAKGHVSNGYNLIQVSQKSSLDWSLIPDREEDGNTRATENTIGKLERRAFT